MRIIGGSWRGRKLRFPEVDGLRPTSDRIRETLFNWLVPEIHDARCIDLFTGSGALGLEALSRGAASCDFVDTSRAVIDQVSSHLDALAAGNRGRCIGSSAEAFLASATTPYDLVFVDPPFQQGMVGPVCNALVTHQLLAPGALVYIETASRDDRPLLPQQWQVHREKTSGGVTYRLFHTGRY